MFMKWRNVYEMEGMFMGCQNLENLDLKSFNTTNVYSISKMFKNCTSLETLNIAGFDTRKCYSFFKTFDFCENLTIMLLEDNKNCENLIKTLPEYVTVEYIKKNN